jgi:uncharacterized protein YcbK (DUF882 family)
MQEVSINNQMKLSPHFTLGELTKTKHQTADGNIPSHVVIENLKRICENWLEDLRYSYNTLYVWNVEGGMRNENTHDADEDEPIIINSGYRSPAVNKLAGGSNTSNHLTGCAVDIRCAGKEQMIRYASILLDIADGTKQDYDELLLEQHGSVCWLHFAVRPKDNRRRIEFLKV